jgi:hypothetical protein
VLRCGATTGDFSRVSLCMMSNVGGDPLSLKLQRGEKSAVHGGEPEGLDRGKGSAARCYLKEAQGRWCRGDEPAYARGYGETSCERSDPVRGHPISIIKQAECLSLDSVVSFGGAILYSVSASSSIFATGGRAVRTLSSGAKV